MKTTIELHIPDDRVFLNFWDFNKGYDIVCQLKDDKLMLMDSEGTEIRKEITLTEFCRMIKQRENEGK